MTAAPANHPQPTDRHHGGLGPASRRKTYRHIYPLRVLGMGLGAPLLGSVLHRFRTRDPEWRATADLSPGLPLIRCDAILLAQVFDNLLDNARSYAGGQPPHIQAWTEDHMLHIAVMDRGPGIDPALQLRLFQVFERGRALKHVPSLPEEDSRQRMGTGVGLALCRAILKAHGGEITWRPRDGGGSVFECVLPLSNETAMTFPTSIIEEEPIP